MNNLARSGEQNGMWKGGRYNQNGYVAVKEKGHPRANHRGYIYEHRIVMEQSIGRILAKDEIVHHINGNKQDNRIENLLLTNREDHAALHHTGKKRSLETGWKISQGKLGYKHSEATKEKLKLAWIRRRALKP